MPNKYQNKTPLSPIQLSSPDKQSHQVNTARYKSYLEVHGIKDMALRLVSELFKIFLLESFEIDPNTKAPIPNFNKDGQIYIIGIEIERGHKESAVKGYCFYKTLLEVLPLNAVMCKFKPDHAKAIKEYCEKMIMDKEEVPKQRPKAAKDRKIKKG